jgi:hypothetical protein
MHLGFEVQLGVFFVGHVQAMIIFGVDRGLKS